MEVHAGDCSYASPQTEEDVDLRRGPWTVEEDLILINYITKHGDGRWNSLARCAGLKRTGKSCRLRWLNYLRPDVRRGNITPEEQLLILELHSRWGNRWSKIAQHLPGRTDNEIKNYWRTRVQKHAKQLQCDVNSKQFKDIMRYLWMPRLQERIQAASGGNPVPTAAYRYLPELPNIVNTGDRTEESGSELGQAPTESCSMFESSPESLGMQFSTPLPVSDCLADCYGMHDGNVKMGDGVVSADDRWWPELPASPAGYGHLASMELVDQAAWGEGMYEDLWNVDDLWSLQ